MHLALGDGKLHAEILLTISWTLDEISPAQQRMNSRLKI